MTRLGRNPILLLGYDSFIGRNFATYWQSVSSTLLSKTSKSPITQDSVALKLPFVTDYPQAIELIRKSEVIVFLAGISKASYINHFSAVSRDVNIMGLRNVIQESAVNCKFIYLSSSRCFDGKNPFYTEVDPACPVDEYGRQKLTAERFILEQKPNSVIIRLSKVINVHDDYFQKNLSQLKLGRAIFASSSKFLSPLSTKLVSRAIEQSINNDLVGLQHFSPLPPISYFDFFNEIAEFHGIASNLIQQQEDFTFLHKYDSLQSSECFSGISASITNLLEEVFEYGNNT